MMASSGREHAIARALGVLTPDLVAAAFGDWRFVLENGAKVGVRARMVASWFELTASATPAAPIRLSQAWSMLRDNAGLTGAVRLAMAPGAVEAHLRGEIFAEDDLNLETRVRALCEDARSVFHALHDRAHLDRSGSADPIARAEPRDGPRLVQLCAEAGWPCRERESGRVEIPIECGPVFYQAQLQLTDEGALSAVADLVDVSTLTSVPRAAIALLLLRASALVRSVKGVVVLRDGVERAGLAAACECARSGADLDRALTALAVACGLAGREAQALRHEALAREYLAWCAPELLDESGDVFDNTQSNDKQQSVTEENPCLQQL